MTFDFCQCEECNEHFAVAAGEYEEPTCQCGSSNTIYIGTKTVEIGGVSIAAYKPEIQITAERHIPFD